MKRFSWAKMAFVIAMSTGVVAPLSSAMAQQRPSVLVDVNLKDADMLTATRVLTSKTGVQFVLEPSSEPFGRITLQIGNVTAEDAIRYICQAAGASFRRDENGVYIIGHAKPTPTVMPSATPAKIVRVVRKLKVLKADVRDVYDAVVRSVPFSSTRGFDELKRFVNLSQGDTARLFPNVNIAAMGTQITLPATPVTTTVPLTGSETGNGIAIPGTGSEGANQIGAPGGGFGGQGGAGGFGGQGGAGGIGGQGGVGGQNGQGNAQLVGGQGLVGDSINFISYDPTDNSFVVRGTEEDIQNLQNYINLFDVAPRQVLIKVEFITTTDQLTKELGYDFLYNRSTVFAGNAPGTFANASNPVFLNYATGNITARLRAQLSEGLGKVVNAPIVRTLNNQPASVTNQISTYTFISTTSAVSGAGVVQTTTPYQLNAFTQLAVNPRINDDNTITLFLTPQISSFVGTSTGGGITVPNQVTQSVQVVARVRNGETMVLGGLNSKSEDETVNRTPVLSDLPIIGQFFRSTRRNRNNSELLIFVTPTIVDEDTTGNPGGP